MRHVLVCLAFLAIAASPRGGGCGSPAYEPCAGKPCGVTCTVCDPADRSCVETDVVKACDASGACLPAATAGITCPAPYDPCAGKACGAACTLCAPRDAGCVETSMLKACDPTGRCVPSDGMVCEAPPPPPPPPAPCAGKACGDACIIEPTCRSATPPCAAPSILGACDAAGSCLAAVPVCAPPPPPVDPCAGKACGASCNPCGDVSPCPTFAPTSCDRSGQCVTSTPGLCYDACLGKAPGASCSPCPPSWGCTSVPCLWTCQPTGECSCAGSPAW